MSDLKPIDDPLELRDAIAEDRRAAYERMGVEMPWDFAQETATADLMLVDRAKAEGDLKKRPRSKLVEEPPEPNNDELESRLMPDIDQIVARHAFEKRNAPENEVPEAIQDILIAKLIGFSLDKFKAMKERLAIITGHSHVYNPDDQFAHLEYRKYGALVAMETCDFVTRHPNSDYHGKSLKDAHRIFWRRLEDICDKSNGDPGLPNWWIK